MSNENVVNFSTEKSGTASVGLATLNGLLSKHFRLPIEIYEMDNGNYHSHVGDTGSSQERMFERMIKDSWGLAYNHRDFDSIESVIASLLDAYSLVMDWALEHNNIEAT